MESEKDWIRAILILQNDIGILYKANYCNYTEQYSISKRLHTLRFLSKSFSNRYQNHIPMNYHVNRYKNKSPIAQY